MMCAKSEADGGDARSSIVLKSKTFLFFCNALTYLASISWNHALYVAFLGTASPSALMRLPTARLWLFCVCLWSLLLALAVALVLLEMRRLATSEEGAIFRLSACYRSGVGFIMGGAFHYAFLRSFFSEYLTIGAVLTCLGVSLASCVLLAVLMNVLASEDVSDAQRDVDLVCYNQKGHTVAVDRSKYMLQRVHTLLNSVLVWIMVNAVRTFVLQDNTILLAEDPDAQDIMLIEAFAVFAVCALVVFLSAFFVAHTAKNSAELVLDNNAVLPRLHFFHVLALQVVTYAGVGIFVKAVTYSLSSHPLTPFSKSDVHPWELFIFAVFATGLCGVICRVCEVFLAQRMEKLIDRVGDRLTAEKQVERAVHSVYDMLANVCSSAMGWLCGQCWTYFAFALFSFTNETARLSEVWISTLVFTAVAAAVNSLDVSTASLPLSATRPIS